MKKHNERDFDREWWNICGAMAESCLRADNEEIKDDYLMDGEDPSEMADRTRQVLIDAVNKHREVKK